MLTANGRLGRLGRLAGVPTLMLEPLDSTPPPADADPVVTSDLANWRVQASAIIARSVEEVFEFADKPENEHLWQSATTDVEQTSASGSESGATGRVTARMLGRELESSWEVTEHIPNRKVAFTINTGGRLTYGLWLFDRVPEGTWMRMIYHAPGGPQGRFGKLPDRVVARVFEDHLQGQLRTLKGLLEA